MATRTKKQYKNLLWQDPERMGGAICFYGTRVPLEFLFDMIRQGGTIDEFLDSYPTVAREQVMGVLADADSLLENKLVA